MTTAQATTDALPQSAEATPLDFARTFSQPSIMSSKAHEWQHVSLRRFIVPFHDIKLAGSCMHRIIFHLGGLAMVERLCGRRYVRKWSDKGCTYFTPAGVPRTQTCKGRMDLITVFVAPGPVDEVAAEAFDLDPARAELVESLATPDTMLTQFGKLLLGEAETGGRGTRLFADTLTRALAFHLLRAYSADAPPLPPPPGAMVGWRLRRAIDHMHAHLAEDVSLGRLADAAGLSQSHFARAFRAATGEPPHRYLIRLRVEKARELLEHTRLPVIEVGLRCGYEQTPHFATMFRKATGLSPRAYRAARCT